ncbi:TatD family hydrolase [Leuconostocaceae bacterium ESL0723]|nr:TatD family hydrolase [Leuconostocaceae bacterium ESL0723]
MAIYDSSRKRAASYDSHTHLNDDKLFHDVAAYVGRAHEFDVMQMNVVGYDALGNQRALEIARKYEGIQAVLGYQPEDSVDFDQAAQDTLAKQLKDDQVVGVGETGLDYHWDTPVDVQMAAFQTHLDLAKSLDLPVIIHNREAFQDVYDQLKASQIHRGVIHSFSGTPEQAQAFADLGFYISFSGVVSFKKAPEVRAAAQALPHDQILVETDAPYLAPVPKRGQTNEPAFVAYVIDSLAETLSMTADEVADFTRQNAQRLFLNHD